MSHEQWHGFRGNPEWPLPVLAAESDQAARSDQGNVIKANEYLDSEEVLEQKIDLLVDFIKKSKNTCAYTGAGLSKSSGIPDYATKATNTVVKAPKLKSNLDAEPTYAHCVITALERAGYLHSYVQQNHDGLPQKSGFPQEKINEIHGAWFDPSNPVVQFSGTLREDLFRDLTSLQREIDLCLCLGTSLSGMNADKTANLPAIKSRKKNSTTIGTVIINLQKTPLDTETCLRIWARLDDAFSLLAKKLGLPKIEPHPAVIPEGDVYEVPYNSSGMKDDKVLMKWDLRAGAKIRIVNKYASNFTCEGEMMEKSHGHYRVFLLEEHKKIKDRVQRLMGTWWVDSALRGAVPSLPFVNIDPEIRAVDDSTS
eukprot:TRINITY_DN818_c0_g1_i1.p1 TRINITY_DN818_c0_g1~~TRINITY_DN818_c0_g1_i1.p1  ORF type:complete len:368 (+),score=67.19 TRINITY_DN818_c0_g1_i1:94-1197(+)